MGVARASAIAHRDLRRSGLLDAIGPNRIFSNVDDAVRTLSALPSPGTAQPSPGPGQPSPGPGQPSPCPASRPPA